MKIAVAPRVYPIWGGVVRRSGPAVQEARGIDSHGVRWAGDGLDDSTLVEHQVALAYEFLRACAPTKTPRIFSYGLKHTIENWAGQYISNGACIAAAVKAGLVIEASPACKLNAFIGVNQRSVQAVRWRSRPRLPDSQGAAVTRRPRCRGIRRLSGPCSKCGLRCDELHVPDRLKALFCGECCPVCCPVTDATSRLLRLRTQGGMGSRMGATEPPVTVCQPFVKFDDRERVEAPK